MDLNIPRNFKSGEFKFDELNITDGELLKLCYDEKWQLLTYNSPVYESEVRVYTVPRERMPGGLTIVYGNDGVLDRVVISKDSGEKTRLLYIWFEDIGASERAVLEYVKEQADRMSEEILTGDRTISRLFFGKFYDGEAVEIGVKTAVAEEVQAVIDEYGDNSSADNSGNYPAEKMIMLRSEPLAVMLMCTDGDFRSELFDKAADAVEETIKKRVLDKIGKTDDFKFISEEQD